MHFYAVSNISLMNLVYVLYVNLAFAVFRLGIQFYTKCEYILDRLLGIT
jgi:hypothetical protein